MANCLVQPMACCFASRELHSESSTDGPWTRGPGIAASYRLAELEARDLRVLPDIDSLSRSLRGSEMDMRCVLCLGYALPIFASLARAASLGHLGSKSEASRARTSRRETSK